FNQGYLFGFFITVGIALALALIYYFVCGNRLFKWSKVYVWIIVLALAGGMGYGVTYSYAKKSLITGVEKRYTKEKGRIEGEAEYVSQMHKELDKWKKEWTREAKSNPKVIYFSLISVFYAMLFFFIFSLLFKKHTVYAKVIPF
ncbi:MAG: hypothetical protein LBD45_03605, partial [Bacteroidales bacterium]|nr:hypothetical protein [Bacteroidales bacterium]